LPRSRPEMPGYSFADFYAPARAVGGDYYFYETLPDGRVLFGIADASGKGLGAAMTIARFAGEVRARVATARTLKEAVFELNRFVLECGPATFITSAICVLDPHDHTVTIADAGHLPALCRRCKSSIVERWFNQRGGLPLGISEQYDCHPQRHGLKPGDMFILYTDGLSEAMNRDNELFGEPRLLQLLKDSHGNAEQTVREIVAEIEQFRGDRHASDDMCLLAIERVG